MSKSKWDMDVIRFIFFAWLPVCGLGLVSLCMMVNDFSIRPIALFCIGFFTFHGLGVQLGYHRLFAHRSFKTSKVVSIVLALFGCFSFQNSAIFWSAVHRNHHKYADLERDPHTPLKGLVYSAFGWYFKPRLLGPREGLVVRDLMGNKALSYLHKNYYLIIWLTVLLSSLTLGIESTLFLFFLPALAGFGVVSLVNVVCHLPGDTNIVGYRNFELEDNSKNVAILAPLSFGLSLHNNHHANPSNKFYDRKWFEIDPLKWIITAIETND